MFRGWGFLLGEIWVLIALAALLGLFIGWLIWGRRVTAAAPAASGDAARLRSELEASQARARDCAQRVARLEADLSAARAGEAAPLAPASGAPEVEAAAVPEDVVDASQDPEPPQDTSNEAEAAEVGTKPATLEAPRAGQPDDLKRIKGIGPKLETLCNRLGFWHFDQIANWTDDEIAWVDANLESFKGRVTRDDWVAQARDLAAERG